MGKVLDQLCLKAEKFAEANYQEFKSGVMAEINKFSDDELARICVQENCIDAESLFKLVYERARSSDNKFLDVTQVL